MISSVGRASPLQGEGRQFEPVITHHNFNKVNIKKINYCSIYKNRSLKIKIKKFKINYKIKPIIFNFCFFKLFTFYFFGGVAQLVRALACHARGREFKSRHSRHFPILRSPKMSSLALKLKALSHKVSPTSSRKVL